MTVVFVDIDNILADPPRRDNSKFNSEEAAFNKGKASKVFVNLLEILSDYHQIVLF